MTWIIVNWCFRNRKCFTCQFRSQYRRTRREVFPILSRIQNIGYEMGENGRTPDCYRENHRTPWGSRYREIGGFQLKHQAQLVGGIVGSSFALISDAVNSLGDVFMSLVVLFALRIAQRPPDAEHPYGHTRAEAIAGSNVAVLVIVSALLVGWEAIQRISIQHDAPPAWALWIAAGNVLIKEALYRYNLRIGKRTKSSVVIAGAWDHRSDAFCSLAVLVGLGIVRWGGPDWIGTDEVAALVVVAMIIWSGASLFRKSASELMDVQADEELVQQVREAAKTSPDVKAVETLWVRKSGLEYFADIHIEVAQNLTVAEGYRIWTSCEGSSAGSVPHAARRAGSFGAVST